MLEIDVGDNRGDKGSMTVVLLMATFGSVPLPHLLRQLIYEGGSQ